MHSFRAEDAPTGAREAFVPQPLTSPQRPADAQAFAPASGDAPEPPPTPDLETLRREAHETGRAEGHAAGFEAGRAAGREEIEAESLASAATALEEAARGVAALRRTYLHAQRRAVVDLAVAVAERILGRTLASDPDALEGVVERALAALGDAQPTAVHLAPRDHALLENGSLPQLSRLTRDHGLEIVADPRLAPGDARVLAGTAEVDARSGELLRRVREELAALVDCDELAGAVDRAEESE